MSNTQNTVAAKPIQVGQQPGETAQLIEEISHSGAANNESEAEKLATPLETAPRASANNDGDDIVDLATAQRLPG